MFLIYINELEHEDILLQYNVKVKLFADDVELYETQSTVLILKSNCLLLTFLLDILKSGGYQFLLRIVML